MPDPKPIMFNRRKGEVTIVQLVGDAELRLVIEDLTATSVTISIEPTAAVRRVLKEEITREAKP